MPTIKMNIPHHLESNEALKRVKELLERLQRDHADKLSGVNLDWSGDKATFQFKAKGLHIRGDINVQPSSVSIEAKVPLIVSLYQSKIQEIIEREAEEVLS